ncbi:S8 family serine peptidase, partial [Candidatus Sumerlaeota bacterium]|nr:S8 family serine peptidase [Candidatus Sumerlaeota bacterium]
MMQARSLSYLVLCISLYFLMLSLSFGEAPQALVVYPGAKSSAWDKSREDLDIKTLFDGNDILAVYEDGSALVLENDQTKKIIRDKGLVIDPALTSPDRYKDPLGNSAQVADFLENAKNISLFESGYPTGPGLYVVQFQGPILQEWLDDLRASGIDVLFPLPPYGYLVWGQDIENALFSQKAVRDKFAVSAMRKMSGPMLEHLMKMEQSSAEIPDKNDYLLNVLIVETFPGQAEAARQELSKLEGIQENKFYLSSLENYYIWEINAPDESIPAIANRREVFYIEILGQAKLCGERELILDTGQFDASGDGPLPAAMYERWLADKKVNGAGVVVQCVDTGLDRGNATNLPGTVHTDILGRVAGVADYSGDANGVDTNGHGTLNAGIISGNPFTRLTDLDGYLVSMGVSPKAKIFATKVSNSTSFSFTETHQTMVQEARSYGASVSLQPWGTATRAFSSFTGEFSDPPAYSSTAVEFDNLTRVANGDNFNPLPMLFVFSAGNFGWFCDMFGCMMVEKTISNPALAKNVISVGAFTGSPPEGGKRRDPVINTSRGPTQDGRIAPTLVAPGIGITGMASQSEGFQNGNPVFYPEGQTLYTRGNGSSHAAAQVAGAAALFTDWWQRFNSYASVPSPAMIKAALINSSEDEQGGSYPVYIPDGLLGEGAPVYETVDFAPDLNQGWGGLNLDKLIPDPGSENNFIFFDQDTKTFTANGQEWEETIYAVDNDTPLYITLVWTDPAAAPSASKALVNDLDLIVTNGTDQIIYGNNFRKGWSGVGGAADHVNNVEVVKIQNPFGAYKIKVKAISLLGKIYQTDPGNRQDFAVAIRGATLASPKGVIAFTAPYYRCDSTAGLILADLDLLGDGTKQLTVNNQTSAATLDVTLTENPPNSGVFRETFDLVTSAEAGKLVANNGDILTVQYNDADDGTGSPAVASSQAQLDCAIPQVTNFIVSDHTAFSLVLSFSFNKKVSGALKYGTDANPDHMTNVIPLLDPSLHHAMEIGGLNPCTVYYGKLEITDSVGNINTDDNGGAYYSFQTLEDEPQFFDDFDAFYNSNNFTHAAIQGTDDWTRIDNSTHAYSPTHSMRSQAVPSIKDIYIKTKNVTLKPNSRLTFYHKFSLEPGFDGAVAEISTDNGLHWRDLGNQIIEGKYNAMIALFSGNPLMARLAWTYAWDNGQVVFKRSWIDLDKFKNKPVQIRFRLATDDSIILPDSAWYIDDVKISYDSDCANTLFMRLGRSNYGPDESVTIRVFDPTLPSASSVDVKVSSETEPAGETVTLNHTADNVYEGAITTKNGGASGGDSLISCVDGNVITVLYTSSSNGGTSNPDKAQAKAFYFLPSLLISPPLNEGVSKLNNNVENALVFPLELSPRGANIILTSIKFGLTDDSQLDPVSHIISPNGMKLYLDANDDKALTIDSVNPSLSDELLATASINPDGTVTFSGLDLSLSRDDIPRLFLLAGLTDQVPFGTKFQFEIPNLATDLVARLDDMTPIIAESDRDPKGLYLKIISRALLVNQKAPTIYLEDGETWETAYHAMGDALIEANSRANRSKLPVEIWVARGRYMEYLLDNKGKAIKPNVEMYGGFGGTEANKES